MTKYLEQKIFELANSEYFVVLEEWLHELITENDIAARAIDPHKEPHNFSKKSGGSEGYLILIELLRREREGR